MSLLVDPPHELFGSESEWRAFLDEMHEAREDGESDADEYIAMAERVLAERRAKRPGVKTSARSERAIARAANLALVAFEESDHPRVPKGGEKGGQFTKKGEGDDEPTHRVGIPGLGDKDQPDRESPKSSKGTSLEDFKSAGIKVRVHPRGEEEFLADWDEHVGEPPEKFRKEFLSGLNGTMTIEPLPDRSWSVKGDLLAATPERKRGTEERARPAGVERMGSYSRTIDFGNKTATNADLQFEDEYSGLKIGRKMMAGNIAKLRELGIKCVDVAASPIDVGGYAWAKYGFVPTKESWKELQDKLSYGIAVRGVSGDDEPLIKDKADQKAMLDLIKSDDPRTLWAVADSKYGRDLLVNTGWQGSLNFSDQAAMKRFDDYIGPTKGLPLAGRA